MMPKSDRAFLCIAPMLFINKLAVLEHRNQLAQSKKNYLLLPEWEYILDNINMINVDTKRTTVKLKVNNISKQFHPFCVECF